MAGEAVAQGAVSWGEDTPPKSGAEHDDENVSRKPGDRRARYGRETRSGGRGTCRRSRADAADAIGAQTQRVMMGKDQRRASRGELLAKEARRVSQNAWGLETSFCVELRR